jgi:hypothetical protein
VTSYNEEKFNQRSDPFSYLRECCYSINLTELYDFESTCAYNQAMEFIPVQLHIKESIRQWFKEPDMTNEAGKVVKKG